MEAIRAAKNSRLREQAGVSALRSVCAGVFLRGGIQSASAAVMMDME